MKNQQSVNVLPVNNLNRRRRRLLAVTAALMSVGGAVRHVRAASLTWDPSGVSPATGSDGSGAWNNGFGAIWTDGTTDQVWNNTNNTAAIFGAGGTGAYNVSLASPITASGITFNTGPNYTLVGTAANPLTIGGGTIAFNSNTTFAGVNLAGSGGITFNGSSGSTLFLTGAGTFEDSFTGPVTVNSGSLSVGYTGINGNFTPFNTSQSFVVNQGGTLIVAAANALGSGYNGSQPFVAINGGTLTANATELMGTTTLTGGTFNTTNSTVVTPYSVFFPTGITTLASATTSTVGVGFNVSTSYLSSSGLTFNVSLGTTSTGTDLAVTGRISGTSGILKIGAGNLVESGNNTYTGTTNVSSGTFTVTPSGVISGPQAPLSVSASSATGNTAVNFGTSATVGSLSGTVSGATAAVNVPGLLTVNQIGATSYAGTLNASGGLTLGLGGSAVLTLTGADTIGTSTNIIGGTLNVSTSSYTTPALAMTGGKFILGSSAAPVSGMSIQSLTLNPGSASIVAFVPAASSFALGSINRLTNSAVDFTPPVSSGTLTTTTANTAGAILGGWATANSGAAWAVSAGTGTSAGAISAFTAAGSTYSTNYTTATSTTDFNAITSNTFSASSVNSIQFTIAAALTATLPGTFSINSGGILVSPAIGANASVITGGTLTSPTGELIVNQYDPSSSLAINSLIANNGSSPLSVTKSGPGVLKLGSANTYTGNTYLEAGSIALTNAGGLGTGTLFVGPNPAFTATFTNGSVGGSPAFLDTSALTGANTIPNNIVLPTAFGTSNYISFNVSGGNTNNVTTFSGVISGGNANTILAVTTSSSGDIKGTTVLSGNNTFVLAGVDLGRGILELTSDASIGSDLTPMLLDSNNGSPTTLVFLNSINFNHPINCAATGNNPTNIDTGSNTVNFTNVLSGNSALIKIGVGTLVISDSNTYNGSSFALTAGTLALNNAGALGTSTVKLNISGGSLDNTSGASITLNNNGPENWLGDFSFTGTNSLNLGTGAVALSASRNITVNASTLTDGGIISGNGFNLNKLGAGTLVLTGVNTYTGTTNVNAGTLSLGKTGTVAGAFLGLNGGTLSTSSGRTASQAFLFTTVNTGTSELSIANFNSSGLSFALGAITRSTGATLDLTPIPTVGSVTTITANSTATILGGWATVGGNTWAVSAGDNTNAGIISGLTTYGTDYTAATTTTDFDATASGTFTPTAVDSLRFNTASPVTATLNGAFVIGSGGILESAAVGSNAINISGGTSLTSGNGTDLIVIQNNPSSAMTISTPIVNGSSSTGLTKSGIGTLILSGSNTYGGPTSINAGTLVFASDAAISGGTSITLAYGAVATAGSAIDQTFVNQFTSASAGVIALGADSSNSIDLSGGNGGVPLPSVSIGAVGSYNMSGSINPAGVTYRLGGGGGTLTIGTALGGGDNLVISGNGTTTGTVVLAMSNGYSGSTNVNSGTLVLAAAGALPGSSPLFIGTGATVIAANHSAGITGAAKNNVFVPSLTLSGSTGAWTSTLDLTNNDLDVKNGSLSTLSNQVKQGYNQGKWNGAGITSSVAAADSTHLTAIGVIQNSVDGTTTGATLYSSFDGASSGASTDVLAKYTYYGDTNLDGTVDASDYSRIDVAFLAEQTTRTAISGWANGDFNYDGVVNGSDYTLMDNAFNTQGAQIASEIATPTSEIAGVDGTSAVPEPTTLGLIAIGGMGLLGRRRTKRS